MFAAVAHLANNPQGAVLVTLVLAGLSCVVAAVAGYLNVLRIAIPALAFAVGLLIVAFLITP